MIVKLCLTLASVAVLTTDIVSTILVEQMCGNEYLYGTNFTYDTLVFTDTFKGDYCEIKFVSADILDYSICVQPQTLNLDCGTKIQFQKYFVARNLHDGELTCHMNDDSTYDESCFTASNFFIVFKKDNEYSHDSATIRVYVEAEQLDSGSIMLIVAVVASVAFLIVFVVCIIICVKHNSRQQNANTPVSYTTTTVPATDGVQGSTLQTDLDGYVVHPTVSSYPNPNPPVPIPHNYTPVPQTEPTVPQPDRLADQPPSYDSLF